MTENTAHQEQQGNMDVILPRVDVFEDEKGITLLADMPGVPKERLNLEIDGETLQIEGQIAVDGLPEVDIAYAEVRSPLFRRAFTLSPELDAANISARLSNGVLNLRIPKQAQSVPKRIHVTAT